jgi:hypothetical protein
VGRVTALVGAAERVRTIDAEASGLLEANAAPPTESVELASSTCLAHEMDDDRYLAIAARDEPLPAMNELLEAERAAPPPQRRD